MKLRFLPFLALALGAAGCQAAGQFLGELLKERPPAPLASFGITSDARLDSAGRILGSFVGEGTSRQVHLISSDTGFIAGLVRQLPPEPRRRGDVWEWLARRGTVAVAPPGAASSGDQRGLVGSPEGHTAVQLRGILLHGSSCGWRGAQAELIVDDARGAGPTLTGPVLASFSLANPARGERRYRAEPPAPSAWLVRDLLARTERVMDSILDARSPSRDRPLSALSSRIEINTLEDVDAADVIPFRLEDARVRYAVSLRERRLTARGDTVLASTVMVWDSSGVWAQRVFNPTLLGLRRGRLQARGYPWVPVFWRRLQPMDGFSFDRDYLWMEQVDVEDGSVLWGVVEPRGNNIVAAAEVDGPCTR